MPQLLECVGVAAPAGEQLREAIVQRSLETERARRLSPLPRPDECDRRDVRRLRGVDLPSCIGVAAECDQEDGALPTRATPARRDQRLVESHRVQQASALAATREPIDRERELQALLVMCDAPAGDPVEHLEGVRARARERGRYREPSERRDLADRAVHVGHREPADAVQDQ